MLRYLVEPFATPALVGLDWGSAAIKVVELERTQDRLVLRRAAVSPIETPPSAHGVRLLLAKAGITNRTVALALASPQVIVKPFQFPAMPSRELRNAIQLEAEQAVLNGHSLKDMAVDWHVLSTREQAVRGVLSVVPRTLVTERLKAAAAAGLAPAVVDIEGLALWNAYWALVGSRQPDHRTVLLLNIGARTTNVVIAKDADELILVRDLELGGMALAAGQEQDWAAEIRDTLGYARSKVGLRNVEHVRLCGGGAGPRAVHLVKPLVSAPVDVWDPLNDLDRDGTSPTLESGAGPLFGISIGLALRTPS